MTRGIEDMLNLPHLDDMLKEQGVDVKEETTPTPNDEVVPIDFASAEAMLAAFEERLKMVEGADHAKAMDELFKETLQHSRDLMDLGFNTDERSRRGIFEIATSMYKNAMDAKNSKRDAQFKLMKILQDQRKLDFEERKWKAERGEIDENVSEATVVMDRNELVKRAIEQAKAAAPKK